MPELLKKLHDNNLYANCQNCRFSRSRALAKKRTQWAVLNKNTGQVWQDNKGLSWLDPANISVWKYHVAVAKEAISLGFDEINLDYVRFPSDGSMLVWRFPKWTEEKTKAEVIESFFAYFSKSLINEPAYISADLFGLTTAVTNDMNIGQVLEKAAPHFDYICPMVYPSHYPSGYLGYSNPADYPYEIIYEAIDRGNQRLASSTPYRAKIRPWIQDFNLGAVYTADMIEKEIKASEDAGGYGFLVWDPKNIYTWEAFD